MRHRLIHFLLLAAIVAVAVVMLRRPGTTSDPAAPFDGIEPRSIRAFHWLGPDGPKTLRRDLNEWIFVGSESSRPEYATGPGHERYGLELLRSLETLRAERLLDASNLADFGLDKPRRAFVVETEARAETLWLGGAAPVDRGHYARWRRLGSRVAILDGFLVEKFVVAGDDQLREPRLTRLAFARVDTAWAETYGAGARADYALVPGRDAWRVLIGGVEYKADSLAGKRSVNTLLRLQAIHFLHRRDHPEPSDLGLDPPRGRWILLQGGTRDTFLIGDRLLPEGQMYVKADGRPPAQTLADNWSLLIGDATAYRDPNLFATTDDSWEEVRLVFNGVPAGRLERQGSVWTPGAALPEIGGPDPLRVWTTSVANLSRLRFIGYREDPHKAPALLIVVRRNDLASDTLRVVMTAEGALATGPSQPGVWGKLNSIDIALWYRAAAHAAGGQSSTGG